MICSGSNVLDSLKSRCGGWLSSACHGLDEHDLSEAYSRVPGDKNISQGTILKASYEWLDSDVQ